MGSNGLTILAIDDHQDNLTALKAVVADAFPGTRMLTALNGPNGIELALAEDPDVILLDIVMPGMDGFEVCRRFKADERLRLIPVVFLTALQTDRESRVNALEMGAEAFLSKPFDEVELTAQIRAMAKIKAAHVSDRQEKQRLTLMVLERTRALEHELAERKQAEEERWQANAELSAIYASVPVALLLVDQERRVTKLNDAAAHFAGRSTEEMIGLRGGEALRCLNSLDDPRGCGFGPACSTCAVRLAVLDTFADGKGRDQVEALLPIGTGQEAEERCLLIATAYLESNGAGKVLISAQDITGRKRVEEALRVSEQRYRSLFEHMLDGFAYCQMLYDDQDRPVDFVYLEVNAAFEKLTGLRDVVGKRVSELIPGVRESSPELFEICNRVASTGEPEHIECDFKPFSLWLNISVYGPQKGYFVAVFDDITERKLNEADHETMLALLRLYNASNNTQELIRTVTAELQRWSRCEAVGIRLQDGDDFPYYETRGFPAEFVQAENYLCARDANHELLRDSRGDPVLECMCGNILCGRFDPRQPFFTSGGSFWTNSTSRLLASTTEADRLARTRNRCNSEGYESVALVPLRSAGLTLGLLQFNDSRPDRFTPEKITLMERAAASLAIALEQRRTQEALRTSEERYRVISENTADVIWLLDIASGLFTYVSPSVQRVFGFSQEDVLGKGIREMLTPESYLYASSRIEETLAAFDRGDESVRTQVHELDQLRKDGSIVRTELVATILPDRQGRAAEILGVTRDITERVQAEARLMQAQKMESVGRLAGGVAHDFNNLLTVINGYSRLALGTLKAGDPLRDSLEEIVNAGERAAGLTQQLLAFSRKQILRPRVLDLNRVLYAMRPMLAHLVGEDVELCVELPEDAMTICADPHQLEQVVMNLVVNARDAMPGGGKLLIETARVERDQNHTRSHLEAQAGSYIMLAVSDNGVGMDEETRRHLFEPFFTTKEVGKGTGLGLSIIQGIVAQSGGYIEAFSEPGHGTTFKIYLPRVTEQATEEELPEPVSALGGKETVLVVEDQAEVRKFAATALKAYGYRVIQAESASEALRFCERERELVNLVLTDVVMPGLSGGELAAQLRKRWPGIKVLFMSGYADDAVTHHGVLEQSAAFIQKPFSPDQLAHKVREILVSTDRPARVVVADDEAGVRSFLRMALEHGGYEVTEAADGKQALKQALVQQVDLVITDLVMPEQEGIETIQALRRVVPGVKIIAISGAFHGQFLRTAQLLGADAVLTKPLSVELLLTTVSEVLKARK
jgi:PAS domain S-box-containing protein